MPSQSNYETSNHEYWASDTDFDTRLRQRVAGKLALFVGWHNVEVYSIPPLRCGEVDVTVPDWWPRYKSSGLPYVPTPPVFAYCSELYKASGNDRDRVIAIAKKEKLVMFLAPIFVAWKYGHTDHLFGYTQFDAHDGGYIVPLQASSVEEACNVGLARLITLCASDAVLSVLELKRSCEVDCGNYIGDGLPFLVFNFETEWFPTLLLRMRQNV